MKKYIGKVLILASILAFFDQLSKSFVVKNLTEDLTILKDFFVLQYSENQGIAFGLPVPKTLLICLNIILIFVILYYSFTELDIKKRLSTIAPALVIGGGLGNLIDRIANGYVVDFISIWKWPNFNLADVFICSGVLVLLAFYGKIKKV